MKKLLILAVIALMASVPSQAQIVSSNSTQITKEVKPKKIKNRKNRIYFGYANMSFHGDNEGGDPLYGFHIGYLHASKLTKKLPLYLECGGEFITNGDEDNTNVSIDIPVSATYKYTTKSGFYVAPYAGIAFHVNIYGETYNDGYNVDNSEWYDKDGMDGNRFQFGGQLGFNFGYKVINFGLGYRMYTPLFKEGSYKVSPHSFRVNIGFNF